MPPISGSRRNVQERKTVNWLWQFCFTVMPFHSQEREMLHAAFQTGPLCFGRRKTRILEQVFSESKLSENATLANLVAAARQIERVRFHL